MVYKLQNYVITLSLALIIMQYYNNGVVSFDTNKHQDMMLLHLDILIRMNNLKQ